MEHQAKRHIAHAIPQEEFGSQKQTVVRRSVDGRFMDFRLARTCAAQEWERTFAAERPGIGAWLWGRWGPKWWTSTLPSRTCFFFLCLQASDSGIPIQGEERRVRVPPCCCAYSMQKGRFCEFPPPLSALPALPALSALSSVICLVCLVCLVCLFHLACVLLVSSSLRSFVRPSVRPSVRLFVCLSAVCLSVCQSVSQAGSQPASQPVSQSVSQSFQRCNLNVVRQPLASANSVRSRRLQLGSCGKVLRMN